MKLNLNEMKNIKSISEVVTPAYDIETVKENTMKAPKWLHFGAGTIIRT